MQVRTAESMLLLVPFDSRYKYRSSTFQDRDDDLNVFMSDIDFAFKIPYVFGFFKETICCELLKKFLQSNMRRKQRKLLCII